MMATNHGFQRIQGRDIPELKTKVSPAVPFIYGIISGQPFLLILASSVQPSLLLFKLLHIQKAAISGLCF